MSDSDRPFLSPELRAALDAGPKRPARAPARGLRVRAGEMWFPIRGLDETGFDLDAAFSPKLRGRVEIHDARGLVREGLVVAAEPASDVMQYDFKRTSRPLSAPPRDWVAAEPWDAAHPS